MEIKNCKSRISGIGAYLPSQIVYSDDLMREVDCKRFGTPENYISRQIGIKERRFADDQILSSDMAIYAAEKALSDSGTSPCEIDLILYCGIERDWQEPATAHRVQVELGASNASVLDVTNACHGFMNGISIADAFIANGSARKVLLCTGEKQSRVSLDVLQKLKVVKKKSEFKSQLGALTVGDAGGAMVIEASNNESGLKWLNFHSDGKHAKLCFYKHTDNGVLGQMLMKEISIQIVRLHQQLIDRTYKALKWLPSSINKAYCHQTGAKPHAFLANLAQQPLDNCPVTYEFFGNLTSASIPVNMYINKPNRGDRVLFMGTGSGLSVCQGGMIF